MNPAPASRRCFKVIRPFGRPALFRRLRVHVLEIVEYGIAVAANAAGALMHEYGVEAGRVCLVLSATDFELERFMEQLDRVVTEGSDNTSKFWRPEAGYRAEPLEGSDEILTAMVDVVASAMRYGVSSGHVGQLGDPGQS